MGTDRPEEADVPPDGHADHRDGQDGGSGRGFLLSAPARYQRETESHPSKPGRLVLHKFCTQCRVGSVDHCSVVRDALQNAHCDSILRELFKQSAPTDLLQRDGAMIF